jgi:cob(I)alamin adenosyltransferase
MKIYTKTGDKGMTSLYDGSRVSKGHSTIATLGANDLLSSHIGMLIAMTPDSLTSSTHLRQIQVNLQKINSLFATPNKEKAKRLEQMTDSDVKVIEELIDKYEAENKPLRAFILPGATPMDAQAQICRVMCRQAEHHLYEDVSTDVDIQICKYMNRLSDFFFVYGRWLCMKNGAQEYKASDIKEY